MPPPIPTVLANGATVVGFIPDLDSGSRRGLSFDIPKDTHASGYALCWFGREYVVWHVWFDQGMPLERGQWSASSGTYCGNDFPKAQQTLAWKAGYGAEPGPDPSRPESRRFVLATPTDEVKIDYEDSDTHATLEVEDNPDLDIYVIGITSEDDTKKHTLLKSIAATRRWKLILEVSV